ncbi:predicted CDS Pa_1_14030, related [Neospora caninum Liverpool]|uniref:1-phosphatidylinositol 4-kinase n=1 Tax=Neospora caninum (strain Liverpool) TaxID=572307 RepID=F0V9F9_NEOCL|nr:predicted CDS Pa_1_14030, related [Neospora caninum Liverpool]CBZ50384.1 predicted CDS Pa_1_14030, related [Neospora caninum Liverpool]|eukprot:XP_003880418.1 predicted CDS Pa_1_14030, related [Neospora caninum Liverpool]
MYYLFHRQEPGVHEYLVNLLYVKRTDEDIIFYLLQLVQLSLVRFKTSSLHRFLLDKASKSIHLALMASWLYQSMVEDKVAGLEEPAQKMTQEVEMVVVNCKPLGAGTQQSGWGRKEETEEQGHGDRGEERRPNSENAFAVDLFKRRRIVQLIRQHQHALHESQSAEACSSAPCLSGVDSSGTGSARGSLRRPTLSSGALRPRIPESLRLLTGPTTVAGAKVKLPSVYGKLGNPLALYTLQLLPFSSKDAVPRREVRERVRSGGRCGGAEEQACGAGNRNRHARAGREATGRYGRSLEEKKTEGDREDESGDESADWESDGWEMEEDLQQFIMKQRRCDYFNTLHHFSSLLIDVPNVLALEPARSLRPVLLNLFPESLNSWILCRRLYVTAMVGTWTMTGVTIPFHEGELWADKCERLRRRSPYGHLRSWDIRRVLMKSGDDWRQELLASQLVRQFKAISDEARLPLWLRPYEILVTGSNSGVMKFVPDTCRVDVLKKRHNTDSSARVFDFLLADNPFEAKQNFIESHAAYSLVSYFLQDKDRYNGN